MASNMNIWDGRKSFERYEFYDGSRACVRVGGTESECFGVNFGLRQGCVMSPWLLMYIWMVW